MPPATELEVQIKKQRGGNNRRPEAVTPFRSSITNIALLLNTQRRQNIRQNSVEPQPQLSNPVYSLVRLSFTKTLLKNGHTNPATDQCITYHMIVGRTGQKLEIKCQCGNKQKWATCRGRLIPVRCQVTMADGIPLNLAGQLHRVLAERRPALTRRGVRWRRTS